MLPFNCLSRPGAWAASSGQNMGGDLAGSGVYGNVELAPLPTGAAVLLGILHALSEQLQPVLSSTRCMGPSCRTTRGCRPAKASQPDLVGWPVRHLPVLFWDAVTLIGIVFERHARDVAELLG